MGKCKGAIVEFLKLGGSEPVSSEIYEQRIKTCSGCEYHTGEEKEIQCTKCGCCMAAKAMFTFHLLENLGTTTINCPLGFWKE